MLSGINAAYTAVNTPLHTAYTTINVLKEAPSVVKVLPTVVIAEISNSETARSLSNTENAANIGIQFDVYSNKAGTANLTERLAILAIIDTAVRAIGYYRTYVNTDAPNIDQTVKRAISRYAVLAV